MVSGAGRNSSGLGEGQAHSAVFNMGNQQGACTAQGTLLDVAWQPGRERGLGENGYMRVSGWAFAVHLKLSQCCWSAILHYKMFLVFKKKERSTYPGMGWGGNWGLLKTLLWRVFGELGSSKHVLFGLCTLLHHNLVSVKWLYYAVGEQTQIWFGNAWTILSLFLYLKVFRGEEPRWRRSRTGRTLSPPQIHQKSI